jgi:hypothetical protein
MMILLLKFFTINDHKLHTDLVSRRQIERLKGRGREAGEGGGGGGHGISGGWSKQQGGIGGRGNESIRAEGGREGDDSKGGGEG